MYCWQYLPIPREMLTMQYIGLRVFQNKVTQITPIYMFVFLAFCVFCFCCCWWNHKPCCIGSVSRLWLFVFSHTQSLKTDFNSDSHNMALIANLYFQTAPILIPIPDGNSANFYHWFHVQFLAVHCRDKESESGYLKIWIEIRLCKCTMKVIFSVI